MAEPPQHDANRPAFFFSCGLAGAGAGVAAGLSSVAAAGAGAAASVGAGAAAGSAALGSAGAAADSSTV